MPHEPSKRDARRVILCGAATLLCAAVMAVAGSGTPPADERSPFTSAVVALELVRTPAEVPAILGAGDALRAVVERVTWIDFAFLCLYPLLCVAVVFFLTRGRGWRGVVVALAAAMVAGDALENRALLHLLEAAPDASWVASVMLWTTVKWSALFAAMLATGMLLFAAGGVARVLCLIPVATGIAGAVALIVPAHRQLIEPAGLFGVGATWLIVLAMAAAVFIQRRGSRRRA